VARVTPFHSRKPDDHRGYHNHDRCTEGDSIEKPNRVFGAGDRPQCEQCRKLDQESGGARS